MTQINGKLLHTKHKNFIWEWIGQQYCTVCYCNMINVVHNSFRYCSFCSTNPTVVLIDLFWHFVFRKRPYSANWDFLWALWAFAGIQASGVHPMLMGELEPSSGGQTFFCCIKGYLHSTRAESCCVSRCLVRPDRTPHHQFVWIKTCSLPG